MMKKIFLFILLVFAASCLSNEKLEETSEYILYDYVDHFSHKQFYFFSDNSFVYRIRMFSSCDWMSTEGKYKWSNSVLCLYDYDKDFNFVFESEKDNILIIFVNGEICEFKKREFIDNEEAL